MTSGAIRARVVVAGRVQGVWFRASAQATGQALGLSGWVRNLSDGRVEAVFEGSSELVEQAVEWCRTGPEHAIVESIEVLYEPVEGLMSFHVTG